MLSYTYIQHNEGERVSMKMKANSIFIGFTNHPDTIFLFISLWRFILQKKKKDLCIFPSQDFYCFPFYVQFSIEVSFFIHFFFFCFVYSYIYNNPSIRLQYNIVGLHDLIRFFFVHVLWYSKQCWVQMYKAQGTTTTTTTKKN